MNVYYDQTTFYGNDEGFYGEVHHGLHGVGKIKLEYEHQSISFDNWADFMRFIQFTSEMVARETLNAEIADNSRK